MSYVSQSTAWNAEVEAWALQGRIMPEQAHALIEESRRREAYDPYEGAYYDGEPLDAWKHVFGGRVFVVNAYTLTREYGGPEEGGWWFTRHDPTRIAAGPFYAEEDAREVARHLQAFANVEESEGDMYSYHGGYQMDLRVESCVPHYPTPAVYC
jgi:hypothetical protein